MSDPFSIIIEAICLGASILSALALTATETGADMLRRAHKSVGNRRADLAVSILDRDS
jgi:hypothetical protein